MRYRLMGMAALGLSACAVPAAAQTYSFTYGANGTTIASGIITTDGTPTSGAQNVTDITGSRMGTAITGYDVFADSDQTLYPAMTGAYVDGSGITYQIGTMSYNVYSTGGGFYNEFAYVTADGSASVGTGTFVTSFTLSEVAAAPEPANWALMLLGLGGIGAALRRRKLAVRVSYA